MSQPAYMNEGYAPGLKEYCVFCNTGKETFAAWRLREITGGETIFPRLVCHISKKDGWKDCEYSFLPGYIFLYTTDELPVAKIRQIPEVIKLLAYGQYQYALQGADADFARWIYVQRGIIGKSKALREGSHIRVVDGPMKRFSDRIQAVNKQRRRAKVDLDFGGEKHTMWMAFDWVEDDPGKMIEDRQEV